MDKYETLTQYFGYRTFREGQEPIVDTILAGRDTLAVMPTGAGKSLCFQVPGLMLPGITLVISPLISLMKDQVAALKQAGAPGAFLNSSLTEAQYQKALTLASQGRYKIIYVAPERLMTDRFLRFVRTVSISQVAVDEAHCVSQWGQDFRPSYLDIPKFVDMLPVRPVVSAFTATATGKVREDVQALLRLRDPFVMVTGFDRPNLSFEVLNGADKPTELVRILRAHPGRAGIVYCGTRKTVEEVHAGLEAAGFLATRYHAGLTDEERRDNQEDFLYDRKSVMVATNAFGMGIDKSDVRFVVHYNMPGDLEGYYQEAGRAGRDGEPADCVLLFSERDVKLREFLIEKSNQESGENMDEQTRAALRERDYERLRVMTGYCRLKTCLRAYILRYFGEEARPCGNCGNCRRAGEMVDITSDATEILRCVQAFGGRFGRTTYMALLRGTENKSVKLYGLEYGRGGCLASLSEARLREEFDWLCELGMLRRTDDEHPRVSVGDVPLGAEPVQMPSFRSADGPKPKRSRAARGRNAWTNASSERGGSTHRTLTREEEDSVLAMDVFSMPPSGYQPPNVHAAESVPKGQAKALFERLREVRLELAKKQGVPAFVVFNDATLRAMAEAAPLSEHELLEVSGVGPAKAEQYGGRFLKEIRQFLEL